MELTLRQQQGLRIAVERYRNREPYTVISGYAGAGKAQPIETIIPTPNGKKKIGELKIGDYVFDRVGKPTKVLGVYPQGKIDCYKITLKEGRSTYCNDEHLFSVITSNGTKKIMSVKDMLDAGIKMKNGTNKFFIPSAEAVEYSEQQYDISPYTIGAFLGDGSCKNSVLTLSSNDEEIVEKIAQLENLCYRHGNENHKYDWYYYKTLDQSVFNNRGYNTSAINTKKFFCNYIEELTGYAYEKRIPEKYKKGSIQQRFELLQGLMDTDGSIVDNKYLTMRFTSTSEQLINDVKEVVYSLGYSHLSVSTDNRQEKYTTGQCYNLYFSIPNEEKYKFFSLSRKKNIALKGKERKTRTRHDRLAINQIEKMPQQQEMICIYVDNDEHLYLTNDYIVTHNTTLVKFIISALDVDPEKDVAYIAFTGRAATVLSKKGNPNATTAHKLLYKAKMLASGRYKLYPVKKGDLHYKVIVVDEVSMLPKQMWNLLLSHKIYILACGDPEQLPPIYSEDNNHVLDKPHVFLDEIMRQAQDSEIIRLSMWVREGKALSTFPSSNEQVMLMEKPELTSGVYEWADQILCATNATRNNINSMMRQWRGFGEEPEVGDKIVSLSNHWDFYSNLESPLTNGSIGYIKDFKVQQIDMPYKLRGIKIPYMFTNIELEDNDLEYYIDTPIDYNTLLNNEKSLTPRQQYLLGQCKDFPFEAPYDFAYGYTLTVWKAQGSEWDKVLGFEETYPRDKEEHRKYLYTLITRAKKRLVMVIK